MKKKIGIALFVTVLFTVNTSGRRMNKMLSFFDCECYCGNEFIRVVTVEADSEYSATFEAQALCKDIPFSEFRCNCFPA